MFQNKTSNLNILIAGGRDYVDYQRLQEFVDETICSLNHNYETITIISGMARGADMLGVQYAIQNGYKVIKFPAQWNAYGKRAGFIRNQQMLDYLKTSQDNGMVIAFWNGVSSGTKHTINTAKQMDIPCVVCSY
jgi:hypothetical protein